MQKRLPKEIFVKWDGDGDEQYLATDTTIEAMTERGKKMVIGTYKLVREDVVTLVTKVSQRKVRSNR